MSKDIVKTLSNRLKKLTKMVEALPKGEDKFLSYIEKFKQEDGLYHLGSDEDLFGGGSDAYYDFVVFPTYEVAIGFVKLGLKDKMRDTLVLALKMGLGGHGYEAEDAQFYYLNKLYEAGIMPLLKNDRELMNLIEEILKRFRNDLYIGCGCGFWKVEDYQNKIKEVLSLYDADNLFVYGTLMKGNNNHIYLKSQTYINDGNVKGYDIYDYKHRFPFVAKGEGVVLGEIYKVDDKALNNIRKLEGDLYKEEKTVVYVDSLEMAYICTIYVANVDVSSYTQIKIDGSTKWAHNLCY